MEDGWRESSRPELLTASAGVRPLCVQAPVD